MRTGKKITYTLHNEQGCFFGSVKAETLRKACSKFAKKFSGRFSIQSEIGNDHAMVNLK